jgi:hypothetical protein
MNYKKIYDSIIDRAKNRVPEGYVERHHIIPKCIGGSNDQQNLVALYPEEHFLCHVLLIKIYPEQPSLIIAVAKMCQPVGGRKKRKLYGWLRKKFANEQSNRQSGKNNSQFGKRWINNGLISKKIDNNESLPEGWHFGAAFPSMRGVKRPRPKKQKLCISCSNVLASQRNQSKYCLECKPKHNFASKYSDDQIYDALRKNDFDYKKTASFLGWKRSDGNNYIRMKRIHQRG